MDWIHRYNGYNEVERQRRTERQRWSDSGKPTAGVPTVCKVTTGEQSDCGGQTVSRATVRPDGKQSDGGQTVSRATVEALQRWADSGQSDSGGQSDGRQSDSGGQNDDGQSYGGRPYGGQSDCGPT